MTGTQYAIVNTVVMALILGAIILFSCLFMPQQQPVIQSLPSINSWSFESVEEGQYRVNVENGNRVIEYVTPAQLDIERLQNK